MDGKATIEMLGGDYSSSGVGTTFPETYDQYDQYGDEDSFVEKMKKTELYKQLMKSK